MNILITGGAGFIGNHLCEAYVSAGHRVVCIDNLALGTRKNLFRFSKHENFNFHEMDVRDTKRLNSLFAMDGYDLVCHLAANSDIEASARNPSLEYQATYSTTVSILECMRQNDVRNFFFASSSAVYGDGCNRALSESESALAPVSYYGAAKMGAEALVSAYTQMNGFSSLVFRLSNVVGPRMTHGVIHDFVHKLRNDPSRLAILGDGNQRKQYLHVSDLIAGIMHLQPIAAGHAMYNIGTEDHVTVKQIADIVCRQMKLGNVAYEYSGGCRGWPGDIPAFTFDLTKIHATGWCARHTSEQAVTMAAEEEARSTSP